MLSNNPARSHVIRGFLKSLAVFLVLSTLYWGVGFRAPVAVLLSPVWPVVFGYWSFSHGHEAGAFILGLSIAALATVLLAICRPEKKYLRVIAHCCLGAYWFWSFWALNIGVWLWVAWNFPVVGLVFL